MMKSVENKAVTQICRKYLTASRRTAWSLISFALVLMTIRRIIPFYHLFSGNPLSQPDFINEVLGFLLSLLMVLGVAAIAPIFAAIKRSEEEVRKLNEDLERRVQDRTAQLADLNRQQQQEIIERKKAEEETKKYRNIFESSTDAIIMTDENGFLDGNQAALDLYGFSSKDDFIKMHPSELSPPTQPDGKISLTASMEHIKTALTQGSDFFEWVHKKKNGTFFPAEVRLSRLELSGGKVLQALVRDITERKRAEELFRSLAANSPVGVYISQKGKLVYTNQQFQQDTGYREDELLGMEALSMVF